MALLYLSQLSFLDRMQLQEIFLNKAGRLRSGWRFAIFAVLLYLALAMAAVLVRTVLYSARGTAAEAFFNSAWGFLLQGLILLVPAALIGWACGRLLEGLPWRALGLAFRGGWLKDFLLGALVGAASLLLATAIAALSGGFRFALNQTHGTGGVLRTLLVSGLIFLLAAAGEEAIFRGYPLQTMARARMAWVAIIITSLIFAYGHLGNPNVSPFTFANTAIAGLWLAVAYLRTRNLWFPLGIHWAWNWVMGAVLGLPVSGIEDVTPNPLLRASDLGPAWLTGGSYGIEGGAACTAALLLSTLFILLTPLLKPDPELLRLTSQENTGEVGRVIETGGI